MQEYINAAPLQCVAPAASPLRDALVQGLGATIGAFAGFLLGALSSQFGRLKERRTVHKNAVVKLEHTLNQNLDEWSTNKYLTRKAIETFEKGGMSYNVLTPVMLVPNFEIEVADLNVLNRYSTYKIDVIRANGSMEGWNRANVINREILLSGKIDEASHKRNISGQIQRGKEIIAFISQLEKDTELLLSYVRVYLRKDKKWIDRISFQLNVFQSVKITDKEIAAEHEILKQEIDEIQQASKERIAEVEKSLRENTSA